MSVNDSTYRWVKLPRHCAVTGDTSDAVHARRRKQIWTDGVQCRLGPDGNLYINPEEYNKWVENHSSSRNDRWLLAISHSVDIAREALKTV